MKENFNKISVGHMANEMLPRMLPKLVPKGILIDEEIGNGISTSVIFSLLCVQGRGGVFLQCVGINLRMFIQNKAMLIYFNSRHYSRCRYILHITDG